MRRRVGIQWLCAVAILVVNLPALSAEGPDETRRYDMTINAALKMKTVKGEPLLDLDAGTEVAYSLTDRAMQRDVTIHEVRLDIKQNGKQVDDTRIKRTGVRTLEEGAIEEVKYDQAPQRLQQALQAFDTPALTLTLDPQGRERSREAKAKGDLKSTLLDLADTLLCVHVPFSKDAKSWESPTKMALAQGQSARGTLKFEKAGTNRDGTVRVKVSGLLTAAGVFGAGEVKNARYQVTGEQLYDPKDRAWSAADWKIVMAFDMFKEGKPLGTGTGTMTLVTGPAKATPNPNDKK